ncbi:MAG TPA: PqqD family protein, partial [Vicinamibacterales bacterium]|nr:PqqD family protein [Vicinamibacterales bacterium]
MLFRHLENEAVLLDLKSGTYFGLNEVGARAWHLIVERGSLATVLDALLDEFDAEREIVERDLLDLAAQLVARKLASVTAHA